MESIQLEKLKQASEIVRASGSAAWMTFVRETAGGGDPVLPLILKGGLTWASALIVTATGERIAIVGNYDADPLKATGDWTEIVTYVEGIREALIGVLERVVPEGQSIAVNYSMNDEKCDGLTHGMWLMLQELLRDTRFANTIVSAESIATTLRGQKLPQEVARIRRAITETENLFGSIETFAATRCTEKEVFEYVHRIVDDLGYSFSWDRSGDPIVNSGPDSMVGHGIPSPTIQISDGHIFHIDIGLTVDDYSSDLQRVWYVGSDPIPADAQRAFDASRKAIQAGFDKLRPGVVAYEVDAAARASLTGDGYPEYLHALGHQVGRLAHDGGTLLGPRWARYGETPCRQVRENEIYTLELGVMVEGRGYLGLEEMVRVTENGAQWLSIPQDHLWILD